MKEFVLPLQAFFPLLYPDILLSQKIEVQPGLYIFASKLGWILIGRTSEINTETEVTSMLSIQT